MYSDLSKKILLAFVLALGLSFLLAKRLSRGEEKLHLQSRDRSSVTALPAEGSVPVVELREMQTPKTEFVESLKALSFFSSKRVIGASDYSVQEADQSGVLILKVGGETVRTLKSQLAPMACPGSLSRQSRCVGLQNENIIEVNRALKSHLPAWINYEAAYLGNKESPPRPDEN
jgi:hypothetical protein